MLKVIADIETWINRKTYEKQTQQTLLLDKKMDDFVPDPRMWETPHSEFSTNMTNFQQWVMNTRTTKNGIAVFGDSLIAGCRGYLDYIPDKRNFAIGGSWANHMADVYRQILPLMYQLNCAPSIVVIGTLGGNPLLQRQPVDVTITHSIAVLDELRGMVPSARIIVYGIPPTVSSYVTKNAGAFEKALYQWVLKDKRSVFLPLQSKFSKWVIFPKAIMTADGVHFTPTAKWEFDQLLGKALTAPFGSIID